MKRPCRCLPFHPAIDLFQVKVGTFKENLDLVIEALYRSKSGLLLMVYLVIIFMVIMSSIMYMSELDS